MWVNVLVLNIYSCLLFFLDFTEDYRNKVQKSMDNVILEKKRVQSRHYLGDKFLSCILNYKEKLVYILSSLDNGMLLQVW